MKVNRWCMCARMDFIINLVSGCLSAAITAFEQVSEQRALQSETGNNHSPLTPHQMSCFICKSEAVTRCHTCGELICEAHGGKDDLCPHCAGGIMAGDPRATNISVEPIKADQHKGWWRPKEAETYTPPACYECKGLARAVCRNCHEHYCRDHAGPSGLCKACGQSANLGLYVIAGVGVIVLIFWLCHWWFGKL